MSTASCDKCEKVFSKPTQRDADQALRMHVGRKHDGTISNGNGDGKIVPAGKRKYLRRPKPVMTVHVNFCPNCGCNLHAVATGIALASQPV